MLTSTDLQPSNKAVLAEQFDAIVRLPFAFVGVRTCGDFVAEISFLADDVHSRAATNSLAQRAVDELIAYCADGSRPIDLPLAIVGTAFQRSVWDEIACIPPGATRTYGELARRLKADARAVGQACGDNRLPLAIACHRVISASGVGGFAHRRGGAFERIKRWLLLHEAGDELRLV